MIYLTYITIKYIKSGLLITAILIIFCLGCNKDKTRPCRNGGYSFVVTSVWNPQKEIYGIGDSLHIHSSFSKMLTDQVDTSLIIDYSNSTGINGNIVIYELDTILHDVIYAADKFNYITKNGIVNTSQQDPLRIKDIYYQELSNSYDLDLSIVPLAVGIYAIGISNLYCNGLRGNDCTNAGFSNTLTNTNKNINLFEYAMNRPPASQYEIDRIYCFRVQ